MNKPDEFSSLVAKIKGRVEQLRGSDRITEREINELENAFRYIHRKKQQVDLDRPQLSDLAEAERNFQKVRHRFLADNGPEPGQFQQILSRLQDIEASLLDVTQKLAGHVPDASKTESRLADLETRLATVEANLAVFAGRSNENVAIFIDGSNLYLTQRRNELREVDYDQLLTYFNKNYGFCKAFFYTGEDETNRGQQDFIDMMRRYGYTVITKSVKTHTGQNGRPRQKADLDVNIAIDMIELANSGRVDRVVLFSGDGDFAPLIEKIGNKGIRTEVVSYGNNIASELREIADNFIDLEAMIEDVAGSH